MTECFHWNHSFIVQSKICIQSGNVENNIYISWIPEGKLIWVEFIGVRLINWGQLIAVNYTRFSSDFGKFLM